MDLFELVGTIAIKNNEANQALDDTSQKGEKAQSKLSKAFSTVGKGAVVVGKTIATGLAAGGAAMAALTIKALNLSGELEQNMGGSEQVFAEYAGKMQETAKNAFSNMGLSTSDFLATANKMGALFQGAGFTIEESSGLASDAMQRAADVASIMGIDTASAMEAIAGAAKGNFTMMDNLGVAMNDTAIQNYALSKGINKTTQEMTQQEKIALAMEMFMDKTAYAAGNYAKENETLAGSLGTAKAALTNFLDGSGDVDQLVTSFSNLASVAIKSLNEILPRLATGLSEIFQKLIPEIPPLINQLLPSVIEGAVGLINGLVSVLPGLVSAITGILPSIIEAFKEVFNGIVNAVPQVIQAIVDALPELIPLLIGALESVIVTICTVLPQIIQPIITALPGLIELLVGCVIDAIPVLLDGFMTLITSLLEMVPVVLPLLIDAVKNIVTMLAEQIPILIPQFINAVMQIITMICDLLPDIIPQLVDAVIQIITLLCDSLPVILPTLIDAILQIVTMLLDQLPMLISVLVQAVVDIVMMLVEQLPVIIPLLLDAVIELTVGIINAVIEALPQIIQALIEALPPILKAVWEAIKMVFLNLPQWFGQLFDGAVQLIKTAFGVIGAFFKGVWDGIKSIFAPVAEWVNEKIIQPVVQFFQNLWGKITSIWDGIKNTISNVITGIKTKISDVSNSIKTTVSNVFNKVKTAMTQPIEKARDTIKGIVDKVKGFFSGMKLDFPKIKMPHFGITPSGWKIGDLLKGTIPKLKIDWYAEGGVMKRPTLFDYNPATGTAKVGGEKGAEAIAPIDTLQQYIRAAVQAENGGMVELMQRIISLLTQFFPDALDAMRTPMVCDTNGLAIAMAPAMNTELGKIAIKKGRGR